MSPGHTPSTPPCSDAGWSLLPGEVCVQQSSCGCMEHRPYSRCPTAEPPEQVTSPFGPQSPGLPHGALRVKRKEPCGLACAVLMCCLCQPSCRFREWYLGLPLHQGLQPCVQVAGTSAASSSPPMGTHHHRLLLPLPLSPGKEEEQNTYCAALCYLELKKTGNKFLLFNEIKTAQ